MTWFGLKFVQVTRLGLLIALQLTLSVLKYTFKLCRFLLSDILAIFQFRYLKRTYDIDLWRFQMEELKKNMKKADFSPNNNNNGFNIETYIDLIHAKWRGNKDFWLFRGIIPLWLRRRFYLPTLPKWYNSKEPRDFYDTVPYMSRLFAYYAVAWRTDLTITWFEIVPAFIINNRVPGMYEALLWYVGILYYMWRVLVTPYLWFGLILFVRPFFYWDAVFLLWNIPYLLTKSVWVSVYTAIWYTSWIIYWLCLLLFSKIAGTLGVLVSWNNYHLTYKSETSYSSPRALRWNHTSKLGRLWASTWFKFQMFQMSLIEYFLEPRTLPEKESQLVKFFSSGAFLHIALRRFAKEFLLILCHIIAPIFFISFHVSLMILLEVNILQFRLRRLCENLPQIAKIVLVSLFKKLMHLCFILFFLACEVFFTYVSIMSFSLRLVVEILWTPFRGLLAFCWLFFFIVLKLPALLTYFGVVLLWSLAKKMCRFFKAACYLLITVLKAYHAVHLSDYIIPKRRGLTTVRKAFRFSKTLYLGRLIIKAIESFFILTFSSAFSKDDSVLRRKRITPSALKVATKFRFFSKSYTRELTRPFYLFIIVAILNGISNIVDSTFAIFLTYFNSKFRYIISGVKYILISLAFLLQICCRSLHVIISLFVAASNSILVYLFAILKIWGNFLFYFLWKGSILMVHGFLQIAIVTLRYVRILFECTLFISDAICYNLVVKIDWLYGSLFERLLLLAKGLITGIRKNFDKTTKLVRRLLYNGNSYATYLNPIIHFSLLTSLVTQLGVRFSLWLIFCPCMLFGRLLMYACITARFFYKIFFIKVTSAFCVLYLLLKSLLVETLLMFIYSFPSLFFRVTVYIVNVFWFKSLKLEYFNFSKKNINSQGHPYNYLTWWLQILLNLFMQASLVIFFFSKHLMARVLLTFFEGGLFVPRLILPPIAATLFISYSVGLCGKIVIFMWEAFFSVVNILQITGRALYKYLVTSLFYITLQSVLLLVMSLLKTLVRKSVLFLLFTVKLYGTIIYVVLAGYCINIYIGIILPSAFSLVTLFFGYWVVFTILYTASRVLSVFLGFILNIIEEATWSLNKNINNTYEYIFKLFSLYFSRLLSFLFFGPWLLYSFLLKLVIYTTVVYWRCLAVSLFVIPTLVLISLCLGVLICTKWLVLFITIGFQLPLFLIMKVLLIFLNSTSPLLLVWWTQLIKLPTTMKKVNIYNFFHRILHSMPGPWRHLCVHPYCFFWRDSWLLFRVRLFTLTKVLCCCYSAIVKFPATFGSFIVDSLFKTIFYISTYIKVLKNYIYGCLYFIIYTFRSFILTVYSLFALHVRVTAYYGYFSPSFTNDFVKSFFILRCKEVYFFVCRTCLLLLRLLGVFLDLFLAVLDLPVKGLLITGFFLYIFITRPLVLVILGFWNFLRKVITFLLQLAWSLVYTSFQLIEVSRVYFYKGCHSMERLSFILYVNRVWIVNYLIISMSVLAKIAFRWGSPLAQKFTNYIKKRGIHLTLKICFYLPNNKRRSLLSIILYLFVLMILVTLSFVGFVIVSITTISFRLLIYMFVYLPRILFVAVHAILLFLSELPVILIFYGYIIVTSIPAYLLLKTLAQSQKVHLGYTTNLNTKGSALQHSSTLFSVLYSCLRVLFWPLKFFYIFVQGIIAKMLDTLILSSKVLIINFVNKLNVTNLGIFTYILNFITTVKREAFINTTLIVLKYRLYFFFIKEKLRTISIIISFLHSYCRKLFTVKTGSNESKTLNTPIIIAKDDATLNDNISQALGRPKIVRYSRFQHYALQVKLIHIYQKAFNFQLSSFFRWSFDKNITLFTIGYCLDRHRLIGLDSYFVKVRTSIMLGLAGVSSVYDKFLDFTIFYLVNAILRPSLEIFIGLNLYFKPHRYSKKTIFFENKKLSIDYTYMGYFAKTSGSRSSTLATKALSHSITFVSCIPTFFKEMFHKLDWYVSLKKQDLFNNLREKLFYVTNSVNSILCLFHSYLVKPIRLLINLILRFFKILNITPNITVLVLGVHTYQDLLLWFNLRLLRIIRLLQRLVFKVISAADLLIYPLVKILNSLEGKLRLAKIKQRSLHSEVHKLRIKFSAPLTVQMSGISTNPTYKKASITTCYNYSVKDFFIGSLNFLRYCLLTVLNVVQQTVSFLHMVYNVVLNRPLSRFWFYLVEKYFIVCYKSYAAINSLLFVNFFSVIWQRSLSKVSFFLEGYAKWPLKSVYTFISSSTVYIFLRKAYFKRQKSKAAEMDDMDITRKRFFKYESKYDLFLDIIFYGSLGIRTLTAVLLVECFTVVYIYLICHRFLYRRWRPTVAYLLEDIGGSWTSFEIILEEYIQRRFKSNFQYPGPHWWDNALIRAHDRIRFFDSIFQVFGQFFYWLLRIIFNCFTLYPFYILRLLLSGHFFKFILVIISSPIHPLLKPLSWLWKAPARFLVAGHKNFSRESLQSPSPSTRLIGYILLKHLVTGGVLKFLFLGIDILVCLINLVFDTTIKNLQVFNLNVMVDSVSIKAVVGSRLLYHYYQLHYYITAITGVFTVLIQLFSCWSLLLFFGCKSTQLKIFIAPLSALLFFMLLVDTNTKKLYRRIDAIELSFFSYRLRLMSRCLCYIVNFVWLVISQIYSVYILITSAAVNLFLIWYYFKFFISKPVFWLVAWLIELYISAINNGISKAKVNGEDHAIKFLNAITRFSAICSTTVNRIITPIIVRSGVAYQKVYFLINNVMLCLLLEIVATWVTSVKTLVEKLSSFKKLPCSSFYLSLRVTYFSFSFWLCPYKFICKIYKNILYRSNVLWYHILNLVNLIVVRQQCLYLLTVTAQAVPKRTIHFKFFTSSLSYIYKLQRSCGFRRGSWFFSHISNMTTKLRFKKSSLYFMDRWLSYIGLTTLKLSFIMYQALNSYKLYLLSSTRIKKGCTTLNALITLAISKSKLLSGLGLAIKAVSAIHNGLTFILYYINKAFVSTTNTFVVFCCACFQYNTPSSLPGNFSQAITPLTLVTTHDFVFSTITIFLRWGFTFYIYFFLPWVRIINTLVSCGLVLKTTFQAVWDAALLFLEEFQVNYKDLGPTLEQVSYRFCYFCALIFIDYTAFLQVYYQAYKKNLGCIQSRRLSEFLTILPGSKQYNAHQLMLGRGLTLQAFPDADRLAGKWLLDTYEGPMFFVTRLLGFIYVKANNWTLSSVIFVAECFLNECRFEADTFLVVKMDRFQIFDILRAAVNLICQNIQDKYLQPIAYLTHMLVVKPLVSNWQKASDTVKVIYLLLGSSLIYIIPPMTLLLEIFLGGVWTVRRFILRSLALYIVWVATMFYFSTEPLINPMVKPALEMMVDPSIEFLQRNVYALNFHLRIKKGVIHALRVFILWFIGFTIAGRYFELSLYQKVPRLAKVALAFIAINHFFLDPEIFQLSPDRDWNSIIVTWAHDYYYANIYFSFFHYLVSIKMVHWAIWYGICLWVSIAANWPKRSLRRLTDVDEAHRRIRLRVQQFPRGFYALLFLLLAGVQMKQISGDALIPYIPEKVALEKRKYLYQDYLSFDPLTNEAHRESRQSLLRPPKAIMHMYSNAWWWTPLWNTSDKLSESGLILKDWAESHVYPDATQLDARMSNFRGTRLYQAVWGLSDPLAIARSKNLLALTWRGAWRSLLDMHEQEGYCELGCCTADRWKPAMHYIRKYNEYCQWRCCSRDIWELPTPTFTYKRLYLGRQGPTVAEWPMDEYWHIVDNFISKKWLNPRFHGINYLVKYRISTRLNKLDHLVGLEHFTITDHIRSGRFYPELAEMFIDNVKTLPSELLVNNVNTPVVFWETPSVLTTLYPGYSTNRHKYYSDADSLLCIKSILGYYNIWYLHERYLLGRHSYHFYVSERFIEDIAELSWWMRYRDIGPLGIAWNLAWPHFRIYVKLAVFAFLVPFIFTIKFLRAFTFVAVLLYDIIFYWDGTAPHHLVSFIEHYYFYEIHHLRTYRQERAYPYYLKDMYKRIDELVMPVWLKLHYWFPDEPIESKEGKS